MIMINNRGKSYSMLFKIIYSNFESNQNKFIAIICNISHL